MPARYYTEMREAAARRVMAICSAVCGTKRSVLPLPSRRSHVRAHANVPLSPVHQARRALHA